MIKKAFNEIRLHGQLHENLVIQNKIIFAISSSQPFPLDDIMTLLEKREEELTKEINKLKEEEDA